MSGDTLTLLRVMPEEAGVYICTATNQHSRYIVFTHHHRVFNSPNIGQSVGRSVSMLSTNPKLNWRKWWCRYLKQTSFFIMPQAMKRKLSPSQRVMKEKPKKRPKIPPKSATKNRQQYNVYIDISSKSLFFREIHIFVCGTSIIGL